MCKLYLVKIITAAFLLVPPVCISAQDNSVQVPAAYSTAMPDNYIRTWEAIKPETNAYHFVLNSAPQLSKLTSVYFDGLGRPLQGVTKKGSQPTGGNAADLVTGYVYDEYGREQRKYLPFAANGTGGNTSISDGLFKQNPFQQQQHFYSDAYSNGSSHSPVKGQGESYYYGKTEFEPSPLNRTERMYEPGDAWVHDGKGIKTSYWLNTPTDAVRIWTVTNAVVSGDFGTYTSTATYPANSLYKYVTTDENNNQSIEFKNKEGQIILKKVQHTGSDDTGTGQSHTGWLCTYYVYDNLGQLRCVIQPKAVALMNTGGWNLSASKLNELCFRYEYDERSRLIVKKLPGAAPSYMVYDKRNRVAMTQDGNMRQPGQEKWFVTLYDAFNRPVKTGLWSNSSTWSVHQGNAKSSSNYYYPETSALATGWEELTVTFYDDYAWTNPATNPGQNFSATMDNSFSADYLTTTSTYPYPEIPAQTSATKNLVTGSKVKILGTSPAQYLYTVSYYDEKGRIIQTKSQNISGGVDIATTQFIFTGFELRKILRYQKVTGGNPSSLLVVTHNQYDDLGRVIATSKKINSGSFKTIVQQEYDALGRVVSKKIGEDPASSSNPKAPLETLQYDYNIRGWMLGANREYAKSQTSDDHYFGFDLGYDKPAIEDGGNVLGQYYYLNYAGNISGTTWKTRGDKRTRKFDYAYDKVNRFKGAYYADYQYGEFNVHDMEFASGAQYDDNGNLKTLSHFGTSIGVNPDLDYLEYYYKDDGNKLTCVIDQMDNPGTRLGDFSTSILHPFSGNKDANTIDYTYDANGNLTKDLNKDMEGPGQTDGIEYNYLNLPQLVKVKNNTGSKGTIAYTYDAAGNRLKKETAETGQPVKTTLYLGGLVYENDVLQFIPHEEGRIRFKPAEGSNPASYQYDYMIKDHLGNVRVVLTEEQLINAYPPASMEIDPSSAEELLYANLPGTRTDKPAGYPNDTYTNPNNKVAKVKAASGSQKIGPAIVLKVMAGDKFNLRVSSWYKTNGTSPGSPVSLFTELLSALTGGVGGLSSVHGTTSITELTNSGVLSPGALSFLNAQTPVAGKPKAYVNWILLDEQFKYVSSSSGCEQVGINEEFKIHTKTDQAIDKNGYLYVFVSNETPNIDVYFDNLQITHTKGAILEETHYYPYGLSIAALSSKAAMGMDNKRQYNNKEKQEKEFSDGTGLELYDYGARMYDPQIGRWNQMDPLADNAFGLTPYRYCFNNPLLYVDPDGRWEVKVIDKEIMKDGVGTGKFEKVIQIIAEKDDDLTTLAEQMGLDLADLQKGLAGVEIKEGVALEKLGIKSVDRTLKEMNKFLTNQKQAWNSNCWGTAISIGMDGRINFNFDGHGNGIIGQPDKADDKLVENFTQTDQPQFGDVVRYAKEDGYKTSETFGQTGLPDKGSEHGGTSHYASFILKSKSGKLYVFSKNGAGEKGPWVVTEDNTLSSYGPKTGIEGGSPFYHKK